MTIFDSGIVMVQEPMYELHEVRPLADRSIDSMGMVTFVRPHETDGNPSTGTGSQQDRSHG